MTVLAFVLFRFLALRNGDDRQAGSITAFTVVFVAAAMALAGLIVDGSYTFAARRQALAEAEQAARLGADSLGLNNLYADFIQPDPASAVQVAQFYMAASGHPGTAWLQGSTVYARVTYQRPNLLLSMFGMASMTIDETASAVNVHGVVRED